MVAETSFVVIIPARYASNRFPGKVLTKIAGKPMLQYVYELACLSKASSVYIATDDHRVERLAKELGAPVIMTDANLASGTERVYEAAKILGLSADSLIVNVQGDEPLLPAENINQVASLLTGEVDMASLTAPITARAELENRNCVKLVMDKNKRALFFSRAVIPYDSGKGNLSHWHRHLGIYAYRLAFLAQYVSWQPSPYEELEQLEQLRALYYGATIQLASARVVPPAGVDDPTDIERIEALLKSKG